MAAARDARLDIAGIEPALATAPRGWPKDHPRIALLRMKGLITVRELRRPGVAAHPPGGERGRQGVARGAPVYEVARGQRRPERGAATISMTIDQSGNTLGYEPVSGGEPCDR